MNASNFEFAVTQGRAQWLTLIKHDPIAREFVVELTHDPERTTSERIVRFVDVPALGNSWSDRDEGCTETLIGAEEHEMSSGFRYTLVTDQREIIFEAGKRAVIYDV